MSVEVSRTYICQDEDDKGRRCVFGVNHAASCQFKPFRPTDRQNEILDEVAKFPVRKMACIDTAKLATMKSLYKRGFLVMRYVSSRAWDVSLTRAGRDLIEDRPR